MGADQGGEEEGLAAFYGAQTRLSFRTCYQIQRLLAHKNRRMGRSATPNILPVLVLMVMAHTIVANGSNLFSQINSAVQC